MTLQMVEDELFDVSDYEEDLLTTTISRQCNICGRMLGSRTSLRQHKMLHLGERMLADFLSGHFNHFAQKLNSKKNIQKHLEYARVFRGSSHKSFETV